MRISHRFAREVTLGGVRCRARVRPLGGDEDETQDCPWGEDGRGKVRLLLPPGTLVLPRDALNLDGAPYVCAAVRAYPGHVEADFRRCAR